MHNSSPYSNFEILESFLVTYDKSSDKEGNAHTSENWRSKYFKQDGFIWIIKRNNKQYFQWQPINPKGDVLFDKGLVSSEDDCIITENALTITTQNSICFFTIRDHNNIVVAPPILW